MTDLTVTSQSTASRLWKESRLLDPRYLIAFLIPLVPVLPIPSRDAAWYGDWLAGAQWLPNGFGVPWSVWAAPATPRATGR